MYFKKHKRIVFSILMSLGIIATAVGVLFHFSPVVLGDVSCGGTKCYGGKITRVTYCTCYYDLGVMLEIEDKSSNNQKIKIFYSPYKSKLRAYYNIWQSGPQVLGAYTPDNHRCQMPTHHGCYTYDITKGTIDSIKGISTTAK